MGWFFFFFLVLHLGVRRTVLKDNCFQDRILSAESWGSGNMEIPIKMLWWEVAEFYLSQIRQMQVKPKLFGACFVYPLVEGVCDMAVFYPCQRQNGMSKGNSQFTSSSAKQTGM